MGLESIVYDDAPDTDQPLGRGPLGDSVLQLYPESTCPHVSEIVLGFEPWFEVEVLRCDGDDFARTARAWHVALRRHAEQAAAGAGDNSESGSGSGIVRRFIRYLVASEVQFRLGVITNVRLVLARRESPRQ